MTRWFCRRCSCSIWNDDRGSNEWEIATGIISGVSYYDNTSNNQDLGRGPGSPEGRSHDLKLINGLLDRVQMWVGSTGDGGASTWLNDGKLAGMPRKLEGRQSSTVDDATLNSMVHKARSKLHAAAPSTPETSTLKARCGCNAITLTISRPNPRTKFQAGLDACWSCRKATGFEITSWCTIPLAHIMWADHESHRPVTLKEEVFACYSTTPGVMNRYFCPDCGVPVFCHREGTDSVDLGMGVFEVSGESGVRLEDWFVWDKYGDLWVRDCGDAIDSLLVGGLRKGIMRDEGSRIA